MGCAGVDGAGVDGTVDAGPVDGGTADEVSDGPAPDGCAPDVPNVLSPAMGSRGMGLIFSMVTMGFFVLGLGVVFGLGVASGGNSGLWALYVLAAGCYRCIGGWVQQNQMGVSEKKGIPYFGALKQGSYYLGYYIRVPYFRKPLSFSSAAVRRVVWARARHLRSIVLERFGEAARTASPSPLLGGSWVVIGGVISRVTIVIAQIRGLITPLITTREPPSNSNQALNPKTSRTYQGVDLKPTPEWVP